MANAKSIEPQKAARPSSAGDPLERNWWRNAVLYEIYPRSFQDSNGDGIGDLNGITQRLDYLQALGVDAIWLTPICPSPHVDFGYDISDYKNIDPQYGTLADFDRLVAQAAKRNVRVILDMVMNHTSDQHEWFIQSRSSRNNPYRDWYMWHDASIHPGHETSQEIRKREPPNNWQSLFGHSAWEWDETTHQYYYHKFYPQQPDLNWHNPKVREAFKDIIAFWLNRGVGGFRFDAILTLFEDPELRDEDVILDKDGKPIINAYGEPALDDSMTNNLPEVHVVMQQMRAYIDTFNDTVFPGRRVLIGETYMPNIGELAKQYGTPEVPEFHLPMDTQVTLINKMDAATFRARITDVQTGIEGNIPLLLFDNHDLPRIDARYCDGVHDTAIQRVLAAVLFLTRCTALFYYGDEIGMKTTPPTRKEDVKDPIGIIGWPKEKGRDGERTPMQWDASPHAGFTQGTPWLPVPPSAATINVQAEETNPDSLLAWFRALIRLKRSHPALIGGQHTMLDPQNTAVLSWMRTAPGAPAVVVSANFTLEPQTVNLGMSHTEGTLKTLLKSPGTLDPESTRAIALGPYAVYVGELQ